MVRVAGQDILEYVGGQNIRGRIDMYCHSYPGYWSFGFVQEASGTVHAFAQEYPALYSGEDTIYGVDFAEKLPMRLSDGGGGAFSSADAKQLSDGKRIDWQLYVRQHNISG